jgi:6-phosphogluconolactonase
MSRHRGAEVSVFDSPRELSKGAADLFTSLAGEAIANRSRFAVALSGGNTPRELYALLGSSPYQERILWHGVHLFWVDERCVPPDHQENNYKLVNDTLLRGRAGTAAIIHRVQAERGADEAARLYEEELRTFFGSDRLPTFDLIILGAGTDGHTASLFPGSAAVAEPVRTAVPVPLAPPGIARVTLTLPVINHAAFVLFLATGSAKTSVVQNILYQKNSQNYPAGRVRPERGIIAWFLDREAAGTRW